MNIVCRSVFVVFSFVCVTTFASVRASSCNGTQVLGDQFAHAKIEPFSTDGDVWEESFETYGPDHCVVYSAKLKSGSSGYDDNCYASCDSANCGNMEVGDEISCIDGVELELTGDLGARCEFDVYQYTKDSDCRKLPGDPHWYYPWLGVAGVVAVAGGLVICMGDSQGGGYTLLPQ